MLPLPACRFFLRTTLIGFKIRGNAKPFRVQAELGCERAQGCRGDFQCTCVAQLRLYLRFIKK